MRNGLLMLARLPVLGGGCGQMAEEGVDRETNEELRAGCISALTGRALPAALAEQACDCVLRRINETDSASEKVKLIEERLEPILLECIAEVTPANG